MMRRPCSVAAPPSHGLGSCWPCLPSFPVEYSSVPKKFTAASVPLSTVCAPVCSPCCSWRCGASNVPNGSRNIPRRIWVGCWAWIRAPEVKTLRRKLARLAAHGRAAELGRALAQQRVAHRGAVLGFLYVDGHVRVYHGKYRLPKAHVAQMRLSMPATSDYWVNDTEGDPLFVVTAEANTSLVKMLPGILQQVRSLVGK